MMIIDGVFYWVVFQVEITNITRWDLPVATPLLVQVKESGGTKKGDTFASAIAKGNSSPNDAGVMMVCL